MSDEKLYQIALKFIHGIGDVNAKQLVSYCGSAKKIFTSPKSKLYKIPGIGRKTIDSISSSSVLHKAEEVVKDCEKNNHKILFYTDADYPSRLKFANDSPIIICTQGKVDFNKQKVVSIVGTRKATDYGKTTTAQIVKDLQPHGALIVSGLAYGIDIAAHKAALECGLPTVAILAGGLDKIYPASHKKYVNEMLEIGGIVSEKFPGTIPKAHFFPARNRIIAGMADTVIVVEAAEKGGALITAEIAHSYDREVFAVPGDLNNVHSRGCNKLISRQKANIYSGISDLEYLLNWDKGRKSAKQAKPVLDIDRFEGNDKKIIEVLLHFKSGLKLDELCWKSNVPINSAGAILLNLEFEGLVKVLPGNMFKLI